MARISEVYYNLDDSNFLVTYGDLTFYFSSKFYQDKFKELMTDFIVNETQKLRVKFKATVEFDYMILLLLYQKIEKRGFRVYYKDKLLNNNYCIKEQII